MKKIMWLTAWLVMFLAGCMPLGENAERPATGAAQPEIAQPETTTTTTQEEEVGGLTVHYIDVGQGSAAYLEWDGYSMLIDAGNWNTADALAYLDGLEVENIDIAVGTHPDADHIGQLARVIETYEVGEVWMSGNSSSSNTFIRTLEAIDEAGISYVEPRRGDVYDVEALEIEVLHPEQLSGDSNRDSLSFRISYGETAFIFTGDADIQAEQEMIDSGLELEADVLLMGHHGSNTSTGQAFLQAVQSDVAIYSAGEGNAYGHPYAEVLAAAENAGAAVYGTDVNGTIIVETDGQEYTVETTREGVAKEGSNRCIDINKASSAELAELTGIGEALAEVIIKERPFETLDDLTRVSGIGQGKLDGLKEQGLACVGE
ncbi:MBL fold metallo-hydrolase [Planococcus sp. ISL-109]|uniref:MBL fold metallo-hydrolase n=1 Tax=Planococcus sp. ISL-109 TaxID=2819166 RepID=UPI001BE6FB69|nr:MBL fold metallo-hydrolase [Planococcus sp. ISL-109]MBT2581435.1 MBL fold metallo-hydrolase [Planococcus sp. ISL-109]